jgi:hypothetical protein
MQLDALGHADHLEACRHLQHHVHQARLLTTAAQLVDELFVDLHDVVGESLEL